MTATEAARRLLAELGPDQQPTDLVFGNFVRFRWYRKFFGGDGAALEFLSEPEGVAFYYRLFTPGVIHAEGYLRSLDLPTVEGLIAEWRRLVGLLERELASRAK